jgi:hypothetical protein
LIILLSSTLITKIKLLLFGVQNQSGKRMKKELHLLGGKVKENYSLINEVVSIAFL